MQIRLCNGAWLITKVFPLLCRWTVLCCPSTVLVCGCCACAGSIWWWHWAAGSSRRKVLLGTMGSGWNVLPTPRGSYRVCVCRGTPWLCLHHEHPLLLQEDPANISERPPPAWSWRKDALPPLPLVFFIYHVVCLHYELILVASETNTPVWWQQLRRNGVDLCTPSLLYLGMSLLRGGRQMYNTRQMNSPQLAVTGFCWGGR